MARAVPCHLATDLLYRRFSRFRRYRHVRSQKSLKDLMQYCAFDPNLCHRLSMGLCHTQMFAANQILRTDITASLLHARSSITAAGECSPGARSLLASLHLYLITFQGGGTYHSWPTACLLLLLRMIFAAFRRFSDSCRG